MEVEAGARMIGMRTVVDMSSAAASTKMPQTAVMAARSMAPTPMAMAAMATAMGRGLHSSTFRLILSDFCGIRLVVHGV